MTTPSFDPADGKRIDTPQDPWEPQRRAAMRAEARPAIQMWGSREDDLGVEDAPVRVDFGAGRFDPDAPGMSESSWRLTLAAEALEAGRLLDERDDYQVVDDQVAALEAGEPSWGAAAGARLREALELPLDPEGLLEGRRPAAAGDRPPAGWPRSCCRSEVDSEHSPECSAAAGRYDQLVEPVTAADLAALPDAVLLDEDVSDHAVAPCRRPHRGGRLCAWHQRLGRFVFTLDGASYGCLLPHTPEVGPPAAALNYAPLPVCETSYGYAQGDCAVWMNGDTLCDKRRGHDDGVHRGHDPSGSGAWFECDDFGVEIRSSPEPVPVRFAGRVTVRKADLEAHQPLVIDVIRAEQEAVARARPPRAAWAEVQPDNIGWQTGAPPVPAAEPAPVSSFTVTGDGVREPSSVATARKQLADALGSRPGELMPTWAELVDSVRRQGADLQEAQREVRRRQRRGGW